MRVYFISDLHLSAERPDMTRAFLQFCHQLPDDSSAIYILGDFFEYWVGDDENATWLKPIKSALKHIQQSLCPVYFIHGNRDFLLGKRFAKETGVQLLDEHTVIELFGQAAVILHGDSLCTQDEPYQKYRKKVRLKWLQWVFTRLLSKNTRHKIFGAGRAKSKNKQADQNNMHLLDVNPPAVKKLMQDVSVQLMIHGHTHRPGIHLHDLEPQRGVRIVLGDWYHQSSVLEVDECGFYLHTQPL
ncbi:UDP-2,3-diacylglucosamine diphosphatase [Gayadomonas joobiniege]|uniref:UDP-2,3-diacylglucosamine diphosphatase n=1 Tax=Gayadomonas joobiniege TaxID=1234606 RepID=UPI0003798FCA|nr:UDP-2,3-diacylglucosamine diphosphatase [Gayadomonas joobiniege]